MQPTFREKRFAASDYGIEMAIRQIEADYGDKVSVVDKAKQLTKFGFNPNVGTSKTTIMTLAGSETAESYVRRNLITHVASASSADTMILTVEGHTVGSDKSVSSITQTSGTATCTTSTAHGFSTGEWVYFEGANEAGYNGIVQVTVTGTTTFTYTVDSGTASPATGTITVTSQNKTFTTQSVTLAGQTKTALGTPLARATRAFVKNQNRAANLVGPVYVARDVTFTAGVPSPNSSVHLIIPAGYNQTQKASTSLSTQDYWIVTAMEAGILDKTGTIFANVSMEIREEGGVFRQREDIAVTNQSGSTSFYFDPPVIVPKNSDVRITAVASTTSVEVEAEMRGHLAIVQ